MKPAVKFIHTADLHLGSRLQINTDEELDLEYNNAVYKSFEKIIDAAINNKVHFVLIAGDVFDNEARSVKATRFFKKQCERLNNNNIDIFLINGNHDPYRIGGELLELPSNVKICDTEEVSTFNIYDKDKLIARVLGQSYRGKAESRKMYTFYTTPDQSVYNIGLLHTQLDPNNNNYVPVSKNDLMDNNHIDYWALGHIHEKKVINDHIPYIIYPGIPQGRDIGEVGPGGYFLVKLEPEDSYYSYQEVSDYIFKRIEIYLNELEEENLTELNYFIKDQLEKIYNNLDKEIKGYICRLVLKGKTKVSKVLKEQREEAINDLLYNIRIHFKNRSPLLWVNSIADHTSKKLPNMNEILENDPFIKEFTSFLENIKEDKKERQKLKQKMGEIWNPEVDLENKNPKEFQVTEDEFAELFEQAKTEIIESFIERRDY